MQQGQYLPPHQAMQQGLAYAQSSQPQYWPEAGPSRYAQAPYGGYGATPAMGYIGQAANPMEFPQPDPAPHYQNFAALSSLPAYGTPQVNGTINASQHARIPAQPSSSIKLPHMSQYHFVQSDFVKLAMLLENSARGRVEFDTVALRVIKKYNGGKEITRPVVVPVQEGHMVADLTRNPFRRTQPWYNPSPIVNGNQATFVQGSSRAPQVTQQAPQQAPNQPSSSSTKAADRKKNGSDKKKSSSKSSRSADKAEHALAKEKKKAKVAKAPQAQPSQGPWRVGAQPPDLTQAAPSSMTPPPFQAAPQPPAAYLAPLQTEESLFSLPPSPAPLQTAPQASFLAPASPLGPYTPTAAQMAAFDHGPLIGSQQLSQGIDAAYEGLLPKDFSFNFPGSSESQSGSLGEMSQANSHQQQADKALAQSHLPAPTNDLSGADTRFGVTNVPTIRQYPSSMGYNVSNGETSMQQQPQYGFSGYYGMGMPMAPGMVPRGGEGQA